MHIVPTDERLTAVAQITISNPAATAWREIPFLLYRLLGVDGVEDEHNVPLA